MGAMYKEIIFRRRLPVVITFFAIMILFITLLKIVEVMDLVPVDMSREVDIVCLFVLILFGVYEVEKCRVEYKYSIIGDQLIIHKIKSGEQILVEDIRIEDIKFIGRTNNFYNIWGSFKAKKYICSVLNMNKYCCIYSNGNKKYKMYFEPSSELIDKVKSIKYKQNAFHQRQSELNNVIQG